MAEKRCPVCWEVEGRFHACLSVGRSEYAMERPGRRVDVVLGPLGLAADTGSGGEVGFAIQLGRWTWSWRLEVAP